MWTEMLTSLYLSSTLKLKLAVTLQACGQATHTHAARGIIFLVAIAQLCALALKVPRQIFWKIFPAGYPQEVLETTVLSYLQ